MKIETFIKCLQTECSYMYQLQRKDTLKNTRNLFAEHLHSKKKLCLLDILLPDKSFCTFPAV